MLLSSSLRIKHLVNQTQSTLIQSTLVCGLQQRIHSIGMDGSLRVTESVLTTLSLVQHTLLINFYTLYPGNCINLHDFIVHDDWGLTIETSLQVHILDGNVSLQRGYGDCVCINLDYYSSYPFKCGDWNALVLPLYDPALTTHIQLLVHPSPQLPGIILNIDFQSCDEYIKFSTEKGCIIDQYPHYTYKAVCDSTNVTCQLTHVHFNDYMRQLCSTSCTWSGV